MYLCAVGSSIRFICIHTVALVSNSCLQMSFLTGIQAKWALPDSRVLSLSDGYQLADSDAIRDCGLMESTEPYQRRSQKYTRVNLHQMGHLQMSGEGNNIDVIPLSAVRCWR
jgi:hypothetical protein